MIDNIIQILLQMELEKDRPLYLYEIREVLINNIPENIRLEEHEKGANNEDIKTNERN